MSKKHDYDAAWKTILEAFETEVVEVLFPEIFNDIDWEIGTESLDLELSEIQREIFDKDSAEKIISDKIIKVRLKDNNSKILFIHVEVQSYSNDEDIFGERMFRYFYRIWDKFRYKNKDKSEILTYNFRTIDIEKLDLNKISDENPLKLVFMMAKVFLHTKPDDRDIYNAKIKLAEELIKYDKVKNEEQIKALADFLEYLFLIQDKELENKYEEYKREKGGAVRMTVDQIRQKYYEQKGREQVREEGVKKTAVNLLKMGISDTIVAKGTGLTLDEIEELKKQIMN